MNTNELVEVYLSIDGFSIAEEPTVADHVLYYI